MNANFRNFALWVIIRLVLIALFNLFQNTGTRSAGHEVASSRFLSDVDQGHVRDVTPWLERAACYLMTSRYEGYPASLVEALASNVPAVVTPCSPALSEILPQGGLGGVTPADAGAIACTVQTVLRRQQLQSVDPMLLARHDEERAAASYLDLIDRCVREGVR